MATAMILRLLNSSTDDWLMIVGGFHCYEDEEGEWFCGIYNDTSLHPLEPEHNPVPDCLKTLRIFPFDTAWMHGGTDGGGLRNFFQVGFLLLHNLQMYCRWFSIRVWRRSN